MKFRIPKLTLRDFQGAFTAELRRVAGGFGLGQVPESRVPDALTGSVCGYCSVGCNLDIHRRQGRAVNLTANKNYPVNLGTACPKGWQALAPLAAPDRATTPLLRAKRGDDLRPIDWNQAAGEFCARMKAVQEKHGQESVAFLSTGQICTEEMAFLGAFAKFGMGVVHGDGNTRQCMATAVVAYKQAFGFDAPPYTYRDFEESDVLVFVGANPCIAHPVLWGRVLMNRRKPKIIVIDPRRTETAQVATTHLALKPKSDLVLFYGAARILWESGRIDREFIAAHTNDFEKFADFLAPYTPAVVSEVTGLSTDEIAALADAVAPGKRVSFWWTMGVNQGHQSTRTAQAVINLALMGGHIGKPGTGANSITGQCNAMGSRLFSNTTNLLGGHDFTDPAHRAKVAAATGVPEDRIPKVPSWSYDRIVDGIEKGEIRALWIIATTAHSLDQPETLAPAAGQTRVPGGAGHVSHHGDRPARRPRAARGGVGREIRRVHQFRTARRACQSRVRGAGKCAYGFRYRAHARRRVGLRRHVPRMDFAGGGFRNPETLLRRPTLRHHRHPRSRDADGARRRPVAVSVRNRRSARARAPALRRRKIFHR